MTSPILLMGPPGSGRARWAKAQTGPLSPEYAADVARIYDLTLLPTPTTAPFRAPHFTVSPLAMTGSIQRSGAPRPGELSLAHGGILYLDEVTEFRRETIEEVRRALLTGSVRLPPLGDHDERVVLPARFRLICSATPCPCGHAGEEARGGRICTCTEPMMRRHIAKLEWLTALGAKILYRDDYAAAESAALSGCGCQQAAPTVEGGLGDVEREVLVEMIDDVVDAETVEDGIDLANTICSEDGIPVRVVVREYDDESGREDSWVVHSCVPSRPLDPDERRWLDSPPPGAISGGLGGAHGGFPRHPIGMIARYVGQDHPWLSGHVVMIRSVHRGDEAVFTTNTDLEAAGGIQPGDWLEVHPWDPRAHRWSFVTADAAQDELDFEGAKNAVLANSEFGAMSPVWTSDIAEAKTWATKRSAINDARRIGWKIGWNSTSVVKAESMGFQVWAIGDGEGRFLSREFVDELLAAAA